MVPPADKDGSEVNSGNPVADDFQLDNYPFYLIDKINNLYGLGMEKVLRKHRMERIRWQVLLILREKNPSSISELSEHSGRKLSTISRTIERMRADDLVSTSQRESDNRITDVFITDDGHRALEKILSVAASQYKHALAGFSEEDIMRFRHQLREIMANLERSPFE